MDPNVALKRIRELIDEWHANDEEWTEGKYLDWGIEMSNTVEGLDSWMSKNGFAPKDWR